MMICEYCVPFESELMISLHSELCFEIPTVLRMFSIIFQLIIVV